MRPLRLELSIEQHVELQKARHSSDLAYAERCLYVLLNAAEGMTTYQIAALLRRDVRIIRRWLKAYEEHGLPGLVTDRSNAGRPRTLRDQVQIEVKQLLDTAPQEQGYHATHWTKPLLAHACEQRIGQSVSGRTIQRIMRDMGWRYKRTRKSAPEHAPDAVEKKGAGRSAA